MKEPIIIEGAYIKLALPIAISDWTYAVWDWVMKFCSKFKGACPQHRGSFDSKYQYINIYEYL